MPRYGGAHGQGYYLIWGSRGFMPDSDPIWYPNKADAIAGAIEEIEFFADSAWDIVNLPDTEFTEKDIEEAIAEAKRNIRKHLFTDLDRNIFLTEYMEIADAEEAPEDED